MEIYEEFDRQVYWGGITMSDKQIISDVLLQNVDKHIDKLTSNLNENKDGLIDFKEEMKSNLISSITELVEQGQSEKDAYQIAIDRFGKVEQLEKELNSFYKIKKKFVKWILMLAICVGVLSIGIVTFVDVTNIGVISNATNNDIKNIILKNIGNKNDFVTDNMKKELISNVNNNKFIRAIGVSIGNNNVDKLKQNYVFVYPLNTKYDDFGTIATKEGFFNRTFSHEEKFIIPNTDKTINIDINVTQIDYTLYNISYSLFLAYWVLFAVWASINIIYGRRNKLWIIPICLTNLLGYLIYKLYTHYRK